MRLVFLTNYYNHHQRPLCEALYARLNERFKFVSTREMGQERKQLGYTVDDKTSFVEHAYESEEHSQKCFDIIDAFDVVIIGSAPESYLKRESCRDKLVFRYSERLYKQGFAWFKWPVRAIRNFKKFAAIRQQYLLCASAYTAADYAITGNFRNKAYKWGYFPETVQYEVDALMQGKDRTRILWCGRFLDWKHPDDVIQVVKKLKEESYCVKVDFIGTGPMESALKDAIKANALDDTVTLLGTMSPEQVRKHMERAGVYLFTSDFQEGWGAVLNESMNSGCAVVASHAIGSVPFLLKSGQNGLVYQSGNLEDMYSKVKYLLDYPEEQYRLGKAAYQTIVTTWNAEVAAERFLKLVDEIREHGSCDLFEDGPCSKAELIRNDWYKG